jgi:CheY-like chemotaxis protein
MDEPLRLENHPLTRRIQYVADAPEVSRGQVLRRVLRLGIESLDPGAGTPVNAPEARTYQVLYRYAIAKQSMAMIAAELDIGERQAYRDLRQAMAALASVLFPEDPAVQEANVPLSAAGRSRAAHVREEIERLSREQYQDISLSELLAGVVDSGRRLAEGRGIAIHLQDLAPNLLVPVNRTMLRQALLNLVSHMVRQPDTRDITIRLDRSDENALIQISCPYEGPAAQPSPDDPFAVANQLLTTLGVSWNIAKTTEGVVQVTISIPASREHTVLIVDDNEGLVTLFQRYLRDQPYRVHSTNDANHALQMAHSLRPDVIILDIMMPRRDGWEVLEALRADGGQQARIVVCSIINDPQLATALGADAFLHKPVDRARLLDTLAEVLHRPSEN